MATTATTARSASVIAPPKRIKRNFRIGVPPDTEQRLPGEFGTYRPGSPGLMKWGQSLNVAATVGRPAWSPAWTGHGSGIRWRPPKAVAGRAGKPGYRLRGR